LFAIARKAMMPLRSGVRMQKVSLDFQAEAQFPQVCVCCMKACGSDEFMQVGLTLPANTVGKEKTYRVPTCAFCQQHWQATNSHNRTVNWVFGFALLVCFGFYYSNEERSLWITIPVAIGIIVAAKLLTMALAPKKITEPGHVQPGEGGDLQTEPFIARYESDGKAESVEFSFAQDGYAEKVAMLNGKAQPKADAAAG